MKKSTLVKKGAPKLISLLLLLAMLLSLAACGSGDTPASDNPAPEGTNSTAQPGQDVAYDSDTIVPVQQEASDKGETTIVTCMVGDPGGFDPFSANGMCNDYGVYEPLLWFGYEGYEPAIISSYEISDDTTYLTAHIDDDIYTVEGYHITTADVLWSLEQHSTGFQTAYASNFDLENSYAVDEYTFVLAFATEYNPFLLENLCHLTVTSQEAYENSENHFFYDGKGSTGPYKVVSYQEGVEVRLTKNENYRGGYRTQNVDNIVVKIVSESSQRLIMLENGELDVILSPNINDIDYIKSLDGISFANEISTMTIALAFNLDRESPLLDKRVRQAICYAIDNETLINTVYDGLRTYAVSPISPVAQEWSDDVVAAAQDNIYSFNLEKAQELMAEAGYADGFELVLAYSNDDSKDTLAQIVQAMLSKINISLTMQAYDKTTMRTYAIACEGWDIMFDSSKEQISVLFPFYNKANANIRSNGNWYNEEFQTLLEQAVPTLDIDLALKMVDIYNEEAPSKFLCYNTAQFAHRDGIVNFRTCGDDNLFPGDWNYDYDACDWLFN